MLMFGSRRKVLAKRLLKLRAKVDEKDRTEWAKIFRRLTEEQLEMLRGAIERGSKGGDSEECVLLAAVSAAVATTTTTAALDSDTNDDSPHQVACRLWRWPDLGPRELRKLPGCRSGSVAGVCCNPYHWSRLCQPDSPPPPYSRCMEEKLKPEDRAPSESSQLELRGSLSTNGEGEQNSSQWCHLAYWELSNRVGRQFPVENPSINVFWKMPVEEGLSLATLASHSFSPPSDVKKAREKIGRGVTLSREEDGVWAYNMSEGPLFVNSPALDHPESSILMVYRVSPGHCLKIFSDTVRRYGKSVSRPHVGPIDPNSVRISFTKGWGPNYSRQEVTSCPTWLEVMLSPCR